MLELGERKIEREREYSAGVDMLKEIGISNARIEG